jgi:hypothetical protein
MTVQADATATDGLLDFYSLEVDHWWRLLALLPSLRAELKESGTMSGRSRPRTYRDAPTPRGRPVPDISKAVRRVTRTYALKIFESSTRNLGFSGAVLVNEFTNSRRPIHC